ncbi:MAG: 4-hydroxythreonine-4-phosphate dehydrogenase PdxA [Paucibacter sp.]|nr:4-hydroxythreonine-4-phosphate dehydrogenase PdxA [Roseateles sp.]
MGDLCGIGPEVVAKAVAEPAPDLAAKLCVIGDVAVMRRAMDWAGVKLPLLSLSTLDEAETLPPGCVAVWQPEGMAADLLACPVGQIDARAGAAAALCIAAAVTAIQAGQADALVTAPIHKEALHAAGVGYPGHTEMLQAMAANGGEVAPVRMMLANQELRVVLVTIHCSLRQAIDLISLERVLETIRIAQRAMLNFGLKAPRIAVAGLNPHAGEGGLFGDEEIRHIAPAIARARAEGIDASGPYAPDTVFMRARDALGHAGEFDVVVAMTHDHGLIPVKYLGVEQGVNVSLGLPFVRTSPDHGTAFDLAGSGRADASSMKAALAMAASMLA